MFYGSTKEEQIECFMGQSFSSEQFLTNLVKKIDSNWHAFK